MAITIDEAIERTGCELWNCPSAEGEKFLANLKRKKAAGVTSIHYEPMPEFLLKPITEM